MGKAARALLAIVVFLLPAVVHPAGWFRMYDGKGGDNASAIDGLADGGWIVAGESASNGVLYRINSSGIPLWQKSYDIERKANTAVFFQDVHQTRDGGIAAAGIFYSYPNIDSILMKTDSQGNIQWQKIYDMLGDHRFCAVEETADGGVILAGYAESAESREDIWLVRADPAGSVLWQKTFGGAGSDAVQYHSVHQTRDRGFIVAG